MELDIRQFLKDAKQQQDPAALQSAYRLIKDTPVVGATGRSPRISPDLYVLCAEAGVQLGCVEITEACLKFYFEGNPASDQLLCRAHLCQGRLKTPPATGSLDDFEDAVLCFLKAIDVSKRQPSCSYLVFNASVLFLHAVRPLLQPGRSRRLVPSLRQVVRGLEEVEDQDHSWRAELMMQVTPRHLVKCLVDSGQMEEAASFAKTTEEFIKSHELPLYPRLFTILVQHKLAESDALVEMSSKCSTLTVIYKIQDFKNRLKEGNEEDGPGKEELEEILRLLVDRTDGDATPVQPADRVSLLLELAALAVQRKHQDVVSHCLRVLRSTGEPSAGQRAIMEFFSRENGLLRRDGKMDDYSRASVEARLKEISRLDQWLQSAEGGGDPQAMQALCATLWSLSLPLLQHNLRSRVRKPLMRVARVLEETHSALLETRRQLHSELAVMEEEDGRLEAAVTHLQKAALLDTGAGRERLTTTLRLLQLRATPDPTTPLRAEDRAALLLQQTRDLKPQDRIQIRTALVSVGLLLAPDDFQKVLDADHHSETPEGSAGPRSAVRLAAKAQHHSESVRRADGHLDRQPHNIHNTERLNLWAALAKASRKQEVWDVSRAASRFCLLYDDGRWTASKTDGSDGGSDAECRDARNSLRLLAEVHFISAEATVQKLLTEGAELNGPVAPPPGSNISEEDPHWVVYRDWILSLSSFATSSFLRAAALGAELGESWLVANAAVYTWNYSRHLLEAGEHRRVLPTFRSLLAALRHAKHSGSGTLLVLLCDAVARGLIQPLCGPDAVEPPPTPGIKGKNRPEKSGGAQGGSLDPVALQEVREAAELCDFALSVSSCSVSGETVPIAARRQLVSTWVQIKRILQQQIGPKLDTKDECDNEDVAAMTRVLVAVEMLQCNRNQKHMEFTVPSLSTLVSIASDCSWSDAVVEMQVWCQLAALCHQADDHDSALRCSQSALQLEEAAVRSLSPATSCGLSSLVAVNELLSGAAGLKGLSLVHESRGDLQSYRAALEELLASVSYAVKAESPALCVTAARRYWNCCLPLTRSPDERQRLQEPLKKILKALDHTNRHTHKQNKATPLGSLKHETEDEDDQTLRAAVYDLLLRVRTDNSDWTGALQLLDGAIRDSPHTEHRLRLQKQRILVKTRLGLSVLTDVEKLQGEGEISSMWRQVALSSSSNTQKFSCYQKAVNSLLSSESRWQKAVLLLEFGEWLFSHNYPRADAQHQVQLAVEILLHLDTEQLESTAESDKEAPTSPTPTETLKDVRCLDGLVRAHTLLAVMAGRTSAEHQLNLLRAHDLVLQIWKVSMAVASLEVSSEVVKSQQAPPPQPPPPPPPSAGSKKGKDKGKGKKGKDVTPAAEERPRPEVQVQVQVPVQVQVQVLPSSPEDWARYACPDQTRTVFRTSRDPQCINTHSLQNQVQTRSLFYLDMLDKELRSLSLHHLTLPIMHLAEAIAHDLLDRKSLSDVYRLKILRSCINLDLESLCPFRADLLDLARVPEREQTRSLRDIVSQRERRKPRRETLQQAEEEEDEEEEEDGVSLQDVWMDKAELCLGFGLQQAAKKLLAEAHAVAKEFGARRSVSRALLGSAALACEDQDFIQALVLLDRAQQQGGDEEFWYRLSITRITALVGGRRDPKTLTKVERMVKGVCDALKSVHDQQPNREPEIRFMISSLQMRGAMECIRALSGGDPGETLTLEVVHRLTSACDTLTKCAETFSKLGWREKAADAHLESGRGLRFLSSRSSNVEEKRRLLLSGLSEIQLAVAEQEKTTMNAQRLLPKPQEGPVASLVSERRLRRLRLVLARFCLAVMEEHQAEETQRALDRRRKTPAQIAVEEFTRQTPEPDSVEQDWVRVGATLGPLAVAQLDALGSGSHDDAQTKAECLSMMGKYLRLEAERENPGILNALWDTRTQEAWSDLREEEKEEEEEETKRSSAKLQQRTSRAQQLLSESRLSLSEAVSLCLQLRLPSSVLLEASVSWLEVQGPAEAAAAGQSLALFQSCRMASVTADVLSSSCSSSGSSQLSALLSLHRKLLLSQEETPSSLMKETTDQLLRVSKASSHLSVDPGHLNFLSELPSHLKILLLQHSEDGSQLYGAIYENAKTQPQKGKNTNAAGLSCSRVAKASVCPRTLLDLRTRTRALNHQTRRVLIKEAAEDETLETLFTNIVQDMDQYLDPLLTQFDFSCFRHLASTPPGPETTKNREREDKGSSEPGFSGFSVVLLADLKLLDLPLEASTVLQENALTSVTRDFSLQLLHGRLKTDDSDKVESQTKKETKGATKPRPDQSLNAIKASPANRILPPNCLPVDTKHFKYIVDPHNEGSFGGPSLSVRMKELLETHGLQWQGIMGSEATLCVSDVERLLSRCCGFFYLGTDRFMTNITPDKMIALNLSECRMVLLFDLIQTRTSPLRQDHIHKHKSPSLLDLDDSLLLVLLLTLSGVGCVLLPQHHGRLHQIIDGVLDGLVRNRQTSGQTVQALRRTDSTQRHEAFNLVLYGLPNLILT